MTDDEARATTPAISFAVPYYRDLGYLRQAVESVLAQSSSDWELVVVDDCAAESAQSLVTSFGDDRISYVRNPVNLGLARNWNECVKLTRAPLVTILHADDRLRPDYARAVVKAADEHPEVAAVFTDAVTIDGQGRRVRTLADRVKNRLPRKRGDHVLRGDTDLAGLLFGNYVICPSLCLRRSMVGSEPFRPDLRFVPDWELTTRLLLEGHSLFALRARLIDYRRHSATQTAQLTSDSSRFAEELAFLRARAAQCAEAGFDRSATVAGSRLTVRVHLLVRAFLDLAGGHGGAAGEKVRILWSDLRGRGRVGMDDPDPQE